MDIAISKNNIPIRLTSERWQHITIGHPEIAGCYYEILETIENPDIIYEGSNEAKIAVKKFEEIFPKFMVTVYKEIMSGMVLLSQLIFLQRNKNLKRKKYYGNNSIRRHSNRIAVLS